MTGREALLWLSLALMVVALGIATWLFVTGGVRLGDDDGGAAAEVTVSASADRLRLVSGFDAPLHYDDPTGTVVDSRPRYRRRA